MSSPPTTVAPTGSAKKTHARAAPTPSADGGGAPNDAPPASTQPPSIHRAGAATHPPDHRKRPTASTTDLTPVTGRAITRLTRASLAAATTVAPSQNSFAVLDSADTDGTATMEGDEDDYAPDDSDVAQAEGTSREDGNSQPLIDNSAASVTAIFNTVNQVLGTADDDDTALPPPTMESMMALLQNMQSSILTRLDTLEYSLGGLRAAINLKAEASDIARLDRNLESMATTLRDDVQPQLESNSSAITDIKANLKHLTKLQNTSDTATTARLDSLTATCDSRFASIDARLGRTSSPRACNDSSSAVPMDNDVPPSAPNGSPHTAPTPVDERVELVGIRHVPPVTATRKSLDPAGTLPDGSTFTLPTGHFGSGISGGPSSVHSGHFGSGTSGGPSSVHSVIRTQPNNDQVTRDAQSANARAAHMAGPAGAHLRSASHTPFRTVTRPPPITPPLYTPPTAATPSPTHPISPVAGGMITSPRAHLDRTKGVNRFDIEGLAHTDYHGNTHGVFPLTPGFLANCGYTTVSSDDVVGCLNEIISAHRRISETWTNPSTNTSGPQVDRILLKSFKLFPKLESLATEDVVSFYDRFQELSTAHLIALMPFDSIKLTNRYEGLFIPGLGTRKYSECGRALMDFLPRLIPGSLSSRLDATLAAVRCESNNGYDYLWRVLELYVPGFDPIVAINPPTWAATNDIFHFAQSYLLFFRLQGKQQYHYTDRTRSGIFLRAIQYSEFADTVTLLQSHVNSYREDYDTGCLPPHLRLHGLAESIHQNAQSRMRDIATPRVRRVDASHSLVQGLPESPSVYRFGRQDRPGPPRDRDTTGGQGRDRDRRDDNRNVDQRNGDRPRQQRGPPRPDRNRRPYLADVQCAACKRVGHVAKHCDMLATAICLERYMKKDLSASTRDSIEKDWLERWTARLGNPDRTPRQIMRTYVEDLDITVASLDDEMEWDCWANDAFEDSTIAEA